MPGTASFQMSMASRTASVYDPARSRSIAMTSGSASAAWAGATLPATTAEAQRTAVSNFTIRRGTAGPPEPVPDHDARKLSEGDRHGPSGEKGHAEEMRTQTGRMIPVHLGPALT